MAIDDAVERAWPDVQAKRKSIQTLANELHTNRNAIYRAARRRGLIADRSPIAHGIVPGKFQELLKINRDVYETAQRLALEEIQDLKSQPRQKRDYHRLTRILAVNRICLEGLAIHADIEAARQLLENTKIGGADGSDQSGDRAASGDQAGVVIEVEFGLLTRGEGSGGSGTEEASRGSEEGSRTAAPSPADSLPPSAE